MKHRTPKPLRFEDQQTVVIGEQSDDALWAGLFSAIPKKGRPDGAGWKTISELAAMTPNCARRTMRDRVVKLLAAGKLDEATGTNQFGVRTAYYRPKPKRRCGQPSAA